MTIGLLHPGQMGAALGAALRSVGHSVLWASTGRSGATSQRAEQAGLEDVATLEELCRRSDLVIAVCPPQAELDLARRLPRFAGIYVDVNAVSPTTTRAIAGLVGRYVDGGIVGPPPHEPGTTRLYLSGVEARHIADQFVGTVVDPRVLSQDIGAASALKMSYAAWTKGSSALLLAVLALARADGVGRNALDEWAPQLPESALSGRRRRGHDAPAAV